MDTPGREGKKPETLIDWSVVVAVTGLDADSAIHPIVRFVDSDRLAGD